ncbi:MAG TPA: hypothetical protein PKU91_09980, partial [Phycisphaerales bacterium]|nr:hypothetical protein [Phycisphaerales bacterium]
QRRFTRVASMLARRGFVGADVVVAAPAESCFSASVEVPAKAADAPIPRIVRMELAREHRVEPAEIESAWWEVPAPQRPGHGRPVMAIGCPTSTLLEMEEAASEAGLRVVAIDARGVALARGTRPDGTVSDDWRIICELGYSASTVIVARGDRVVIEHRDAPSAVQQMVARVCEECRAEPAVAAVLCRIAPSEWTGERRSASFAAPRVARAVREGLSAAARAVSQAVQYHRHRYGHSDQFMDRIVVGEPWIAERFMAHMAASGDAAWRQAPQGDGAARGLSLWNGEGDR